MRLRTLALVSVLIFVLVSAVFVSEVGASPTHVPAPKRNFIATSPYKSQWLCILWHESRSTLQSLNLTDNNRYGSSGIFQIEQGTWQAHQLTVHVPYSVHVWQASVSQQFAVAQAIFKADGFRPWWGDGCF